MATDFNKRKKLFGETKMNIVPTKTSEELAKKNNPQFQGMQTREQVLAEAIQGKRALSEEEKFKYQLSREERKAIEKQSLAVATAATKTPEQKAKEQATSDLAAKQAAELSALATTDFTQLGQQPQPTTETKTNIFGKPILPQGEQMIQDLKGVGLVGAVAAGGQFLPEAAAGIKAVQAVKAAKGLKTAGALTKSIAGFSILGGISFGYNALTSGRANRIKSDIDDLVSMDVTLARDGIKAGLDPYEIVNQLKDTEDVIKDKAAELNAAKKFSIKSRLTGDDTQEYLRKQLTKVTLKRQIVEQYLIDGDINKFNLMMGSEISE